MTIQLKPLKWKSTVLPPEDAKRPQCRVIYSYNGTTGHEEVDDTDQVDWLITIAYETNSEEE